MDAGRGLPDLLLAKAAFPGSVARFAELVHAVARDFDVAVVEHAVDAASTDGESCRFASVKVRGSRERERRDAFSREVPADFESRAI